MICYKEGYKRQLTKTCTCQISICPPEDIDSYFISLTKTGLLTARRGYAWDGSSGPTLDTKNSMEASLVHDALYQLMRMNMLSREHREAADLEYERICRIKGRTYRIKEKIHQVKGMSKFRAWYQFSAVRKFASFATDPKNKKIEYCIEDKTKET